MTKEKFHELIRLLEDKTSNDKAIWSRTSSESEFRLFLQKGAITINFYDDGMGTSYVSFTIYNENGDAIDKFVSSDADDDFITIYNLYIKIYDKYYKIDETLNSMFNELSSDKIIGSSSNS